MSFLTEDEPSEENNYETFRWSNNLMITTCLDGSGCEFTPELNIDANTFVPMYDIHRGVHYISGQCAMCNDAIQVEPWDVSLNCEPLQEEKDYVNTGLVNSTESLIHLMNAETCTISYRVSGEHRTCDPGTECSSIDICGDPSTGNWPTGSFSLTLVFDFDPRKGLTVGKHEPPECPFGEVYVPNEDRCRPQSCPSGFVLDGSDCIPEPSNITAVVTGIFSVEPTIQIIETLHQDKSQLENNIQQNVVDILNTFNVTHNNLKVISNFNQENQVFKTENVIQCNCDYSSLFAANNSVHPERFKESILKEVRKEVMTYLMARYIHIDSLQTDIIFEINATAALKQVKLECSWLVYQENETQSGNETITVVSTGKTYTSGRYEFLDETVIVCDTDLNVSEEETDDTDLALDIITLTCVGISIICLIIRIILQFFICSFRKRIGKIQLQLVIALLIAFLMLIVGPFLSRNAEACTTAAILMAYGFLAAFIWMNVIAVDTWLVFRPSAAFSRSDEEKRSFIVHYVVGWGIPLLLVGLSLGMNYSDIDERFRPEFGGSRCWYTQRYAMLIYFGVSMALSILLNIYFYVHTSINLCTAFKNAMATTQIQKSHFLIYIRLFVIMGITWIFGFISAFTDELALQIIFIILVSLQGLFLFVSFVCNKAVLSEMRKKSKENSSTTPGKKTESTAVSGSKSEPASSKSESKV